MIVDVCRDLESVLWSWEGTQLPVPTSGSHESELDCILDAHGFFLSTQANETDAVIDALGAVSMANVQGHSVPFRVKEQPIQNSVSHLMPEAKRIAAHPLVTCRTRFSAQPILLNLGVEYTLVMQETL